MSSSPTPRGSTVTEWQRTLPSWIRALARPVAGRTALIVELFVFWMFFQYFSLAQQHVRGSRAESVRNAHHLFALEKRLHIDIELPLNRALASVPDLAKAAGYYYGCVLATVPIALAWAWWYNPEGFRRLRRGLILSTLPSLLVFWLLPMAPPRFAVPGISDIDFVYQIFDGKLSHDTSRSANLYAAMPSLHIAWSSWVGFTIYDTMKRRRPYIARLALLYPVITAWDVMATGNHFFLDTVAGFLLFCAGTGWATLAGGAERRIWSGEPVDDDPEFALDSHRTADESAAANDDDEREPREAPNVELPSRGERAP